MVAGLSYYQFVIIVLSLLIIYELSEISNKLSIFLQIVQKREPIGYVVER
jgi:uncharacterized membrane protein